jgi:hypothetical protein
LSQSLLQLSAAALSFFFLSSQLWQFLSDNLKYHSDSLSLSLILSYLSRS